MFSFKSVSSDALFIKVRDHGRRQRAKEKTETYERPGGDGDYIEHTDFYEPYSRGMELYLMDNDYASETYALLRGRGKLETSFDPGLFFHASVVSTIDAEEAFKIGINQLGVVFEINPPFAYHKSGALPVSFTSGPVTLFNPGTRFSLPVVRIEGTGDVTLQVNGKFYVITGLEGFIVLDREEDEIYKDLLPQGRKVAGDMDDLILIPGDNVISWTGAVTKIEIIPNWRDY